MGSLKVYIYPEFRGEDKGDGGVRRVVEAQLKYIPRPDCEVVATPDAADLIAVHIAATRRLLTRFQGKPIVLHNHGLYWDGFEWANWALKANAECMEVIRQADAITAPSEWVAQALRRNSLRDIAVIGHGIDLDEWPFSSEHEGFVLWNKTRPDAVCDPASMLELARLAPDIPFVSTFGKNDLKNVALTGRIPYDLAKKAIRDAAVYLCTTKETFGIGTLEAMASGVPVLAWRWGGQVDIIEHKKTGWLAEPGNFNDLLDGLYYCFEHRDEIAKEARAVVEERYQWKDVVLDYVWLYEEVVKKARQSRPKISVIVPAYNLAEFLPEALDSIVAQTEKDWECIVVDDASPDDCGTIAATYAEHDTRFHAITNKENQFLAGALNTGIAASKGKYIIALDADNVLPPDTLAVLGENLDKERSLHIVYGNVEFLEPDGKRWHSGWPMEFRAEWQLTRRNDNDRPANLVPSGAMYRRCVWELTGGYRRRYRTAEDADFWTRATSYGFRAKMVTGADTLIYRNREDSMSRIEKLQDWTAWLPWSNDLSLPPAAVVSDKQAPVPSYDPPKIAVIIPVGPAHTELYVDAIDSVDAQALRDWECIVVNDSGRKLPWVPTWARVIETSGSIGVAAARNLGVKAATAKLFVPLDADDTLEATALSEMYRIWEEFGGYVYCDFFEKWQDKEELNIWATEEYDAKALLRKGCLHAVTGLYPVEAWERIEGFDEEVSAWEDWDFQLNLAALGICGTRAPMPLFTYRKDTGQRREGNYAQFESSKAAIYDKWKSYFDGQEELMGCRACPGGGGGRVTAPSSPLSSGLPTPPAGDGNGFAVVEYTGMKLGVMRYRAPSGQLYRFGGTSTEKQKYVHKKDAEYFATMPDFRIVQMEKPREVTA